jgi:hypothetical protein
MATLYHVDLLGDAAWPHQCWVQPIQVVCRHDCRAPRKQVANHILWSSSPSQGGGAQPSIVPSAADCCNTSSTRTVAKACSGGLPALAVRVCRPEP